MYHNNQSFCCFLYCFVSSEQKVLQTRNFKPNLHERIAIMKHVQVTTVSLTCV